MSAIMKSIVEWQMQNDFARAYCISNSKFLRSAIEDYIRPIFQHGDIVLEIECGANNGYMYLSKLCQGSRGPCIFYQGSWLTPNEFQFVSGRETAKDWKRSIRHCGKSMKLLLNKGILSTHPVACDCDACRTATRINRCRLLDPYASPDQMVSSFANQISDFHSTEHINSQASDVGVTRETDLSKSVASGHYKAEKQKDKITSDEDQFHDESDDDSDDDESELDHEDSNETTKLASQQPMAAAPPKHRRKKTYSRASMTPPVKTERTSPDLDGQRNTPSGSSRSDSPPSPVDPSLRSAGFPGTPPQIFTAPERFSPSRPQVKPEAPTPIRNYSDFMRSLAAKYNNNSALNNDYYSTRPGYFPTLDPRFTMKPPGAPFLGLASLGQAAVMAAAMASKKEESEKKCDQPPSNFSNNASMLNASTLPMHLAALNQSMGAGLGTYQMMDMSSTQALLNIVRSASSQSNNSETRSTPKRSLDSPIATSSPLDLSNMQIKKARLDDSGNDSISGKDDRKSEMMSPVVSALTPKPEAVCENHCSDFTQEMSSWSVDRVSGFVGSIDLCAEYAEVFREHSIDGSALPLLTDDHLTTKLKMKLGPALKLKSAIAQKLGHCTICLHCTHCHSSPEKKFFKNNYGVNHR